ncbi:MAG: Mth938-like domain-containing protein [Chloroflexota bacterium]
MTTKLSPQITAFKWGRVDVDGFSEPFRDVKLYPVGARAWDWSETGTRHQPGIQPADVTELLEHGATVVVLSKGVLEKLYTMPETIAMLEERGVTVHVLQTEQAVEKYNELCATEAVGALIHSTC